MRCSLGEAVAFAALVVAQAPLPSSTAAAILEDDACGPKAGGETYSYLLQRTAAFAKGGAGNPPALGTSQSAGLVAQTPLLPLSQAQQLPPPPAGGSGVRLATALVDESSAMHARTALQSPFLPLSQEQLTQLSQQPQQQGGQQHDQLTALSLAPQAVSQPLAYQRQAPPEVARGRAPRIPVVEPSVEVGEALADEALVADLLRDLSEPLPKAGPRQSVPLARAGMLHEVSQEAEEARPPDVPEAIPQQTGGQAAALPSQWARGAAEARLPDVPEAIPHQTGGHAAALPSQWARAGLGVAFADQEFLNSLLPDLNATAANVLPDVWARAGSGVALTDPELLAASQAQVAAAAHKVGLMPRRSQAQAESMSPMAPRLSSSRHLAGAAQPGDVSGASRVPRSTQHSSLTLLANRTTRGVAPSAPRTRTGVYFQEDAERVSQHPRGRQEDSEATLQPRMLQRENRLLHHQKQELRLENSELHQQLAEVARAREAEQRRGAVRFELCFFGISVGSFVVGLWFLKQWKSWKRHLRQEQKQKPTQEPADESLVAFFEFVFHKYSPLDWLGLSPALVCNLSVVFLFAVGGFSFLWWKHMVQPVLRTLLVYVYLIVVVVAILAVLVYDLWETIHSHQQSIFAIVEKVGKCYDAARDGLDKVVHPGQAKH